MSFPLQYGSTGDQVKIVQAILNGYLESRGMQPIQIDGIWGPQTEAAAVQFFPINKVPEAALREMEKVLIQQANSVMSQIVAADKVNYAYLLANQEIITRLKEAGYQVQPYEAALNRLAASYQERQYKLDTSSALQLQRKAEAGLKWLSDKWQATKAYFGISGAPAALVAPLVYLALGAIAGISALIVYHQFKGDAFNAEKEVRENEALQVELRRIDPQIADNIRKIVTGMVDDAFTTGKKAGTFSFGTIGGVLLLILAVSASNSSK